MKRLLGNFYVQLAAGYAVFAGVLVARVVLFPENAKVLLSPMYGWWAPRLSWWAAPAAVVLAVAVFLVWRFRGAARGWVLYPLAFAACVAVNLMPGGWAKFPFRSFRLYQQDARWLYGNANVFRNYVAITADFNQHCRVRPGMTYWLLGLADKLVSGNVVVLQLAIIAVGALGVLAAYALARTLRGRDESYLAAALVTVAPSFLIYGAWMDGAYAPLGAGLLALGLLSFTRNRGWVYALAAGFVLAFALTTAYTLAPLVGFLAAVAVGVSVVAKPRLRPGLNLALIIVSAFAFLALFQLVTGYDHLAVFKRAYWTAQALAPGGDNILKMLARLAGGGGLNVIREGQRPYVIWVFANLFAFFGMLGIPAAILAAREVWGIIRDRAARRTPYGAFVLAFAVAFLGYNFSGVVLGETERVWIFLIGGFAVPAAAGLRRLLEEKKSAAPLAAILILSALHGAVYHVLIG